MGTLRDELAAKIKGLPDTEKIELVDSILTQLDRPDPEIDRVWADEARRRWQAYKAGKLETVSYDAKHHRPDKEESHRGFRQKK